MRHRLLASYHRKPYATTNHTFHLMVGLGSMIGELWMGCQREVACQDVHLRRCVSFDRRLSENEEIYAFPMISKVFGKPPGCFYFCTGPFGADLAETRGFPIVLKVCGLLGTSGNRWKSMGNP